ncbi:hypothetical protein QYF61_007016 [Mycteria americana]|uniref:Uncharacterized protein n=1 Tax=Mycteria americana TaxID=33587 RepID=A0AAN7MI77_MYCAM|nr:hypothetical protein QYF61_007016 [Mycteria americana]
MGPAVLLVAVQVLLVLLVPHAVDEGVHCWRHHRVQNSHRQIQGWGGDGGGLQAGNHDSADKQGDHSQHSIEKPTAPGSCCHDETSSAAQEGPVVQGFADGNVAVIGHDEGIGHGFGDSGGDGAQIKNRQVEEEEVHGAVEAVVAGYGSDDEAIAQESSQVDAQEEPEVQELQLPCVCKCQEEELGDGAAVGHLLPQGMGTCPRKRVTLTLTVLLKNPFGNALGVIWSCEQP